MALVSAGSAPARKPLLLHSLAEERGGINGSSHIYLGLVQRDILSVVCAWRNRKRVVYGVVFLLLLLIEDLFGCTCIHFNLYVLGGLEYKFHPNSLRHLWIDVDTYAAKQNIMRYVGPVFFLQCLVGKVVGWGHPIERIFSLDSGSLHPSKSKKPGKPGSCPETTVHGRAGMTAMWCLEAVAVGCGRAARWSGCGGCLLELRW